jgi:uncharacterized protein
MFEWDPVKSASNLEKHGISFDEAKHIFDGPVLTCPDTREYGEAREISYGRLSTEIVVCVIHTYRDGKKRIISARKAKSKEREGFNAYLKKATS